MYKEKMIASLLAGEITDLQQTHLKQEFIRAVEKLGFVLQENKKCSLRFQHGQMPELYLGIAVTQDCSDCERNPDEIQWGKWELQNDEGQPLCVNGQDQTHSDDKSCAGFWMEGLESIPGFISIYTQHR